MMSIQLNTRKAAVALTLGALLAGVSFAMPHGAEAADFDAYGVKVTLNQSLRDMLPEDVKTKNKLTFTTDANAPPRTFIDAKGNIAGVIPDLLNAVGATLGVEIAIEKNSFDAEVPGVQSGRFDATTGTGDFPHRREKLDLVDYYKAGYLYLVAAGNPKGVTDDLLSQCGLRVGVLKGTTQETMVHEQSTKCVDAGKPAIELQSFSNVLLPVPLSAGRIDVAWENTSTGYQVSAESPAKFAVAGNPIFAAYLGLGVSKERTELRDTLQKTMQSLMDSGAYAAIFKQWNQTELMMDYISLNSDTRK